MEQEVPVVISTPLFITTKKKLYDCDNHVVNPTSFLNTFYISC